MAIGDPDFALEKLREFLALIAERDDDEIRKLLPVIEAIAKQMDPGKVSELKSVTVPLGGVSWGSARGEAIRLVGIVERQADIQRISGPTGPMLAAGQLHPWVWHAVVNLWDGGHYKQAVNAAAATVEEQTQLELRRGDLSGAPLYTEAFKVGKVGEVPDGRRLRFPHLKELTEDGKRNQNWVSAHEGAMHFGRGCAQGIRNLNAHGTGELPEQEALEYLASLSVLARWVDACEPVPADSGTIDG